MSHITKGANMFLPHKVTNPLNSTSHSLSFPLFLSRFLRNQTEDERTQIKVLPTQITLPKIHASMGRLVISS